MIGRNCAGGSRPPVGCLPADQRFCSQHLAGAHVDFGLVVEHKFVCVQGVTDSFDVLVVSAHAAILARIKNVVSILALHFCLVHRLVGLAQELFRIHIHGLRKERYPDAG